MENKSFPYIEYTKESYSETEMIKRAKDHFHYMDKRRTVREFDTRPIPKNVLENLILCASTAPSGAHKQPWTFCVVTNKELQRKIRIAAEEEEEKSYNGRMTAEWLEDLAPLGTDWHKPFLETAPALIIVFKKSYEIVNGKKKNNYYPVESVGLASGFLLEAIHYCGLVALTHTPSPMGFLCDILQRPENEKPFLLIPVGYPLQKTQVPDLQRKTLQEMAVFFE